MVQLKGNLIPAYVLQLEISCVKIKSCVQYLNRCPLCLCSNQANCLAHPQMFHLLLNKLLMKLNINCIHPMNLRILSLYVPIDPWIDCPTEKLLTCSCVQYLIPCCLVCYHLAWEMDPLLAIESLLTSLGLACQLVGSQ